MSRREELEEATRSVGLFLASYSPGDGVTRYRFFDNPGNTYFGPENGIYTALGLGEAETFLSGYSRGYYRGLEANVPAQ